MAESSTLHLKYILAELDRLSRVVVENNDRAIAVHERMARIERDTERINEDRIHLTATVEQIKQQIAKAELKLAWYAGGLAALVFLIGIMKWAIEFVKK